jgi:ABC-type transport system involved in multi-copper enzyme maturation permease subunit
MQTLAFLSVAVSVAIVTIVIGLALTGAPNWHFTILDVVLDMVGGAVFGIFALALSSYWKNSRALVQVAIEIIVVVLGILTVLTVEGGAARAILFGL